LSGTGFGHVAINCFIALLGLEPRWIMLFPRQIFFKLTQFHVAVEHEFQSGLI